MEPPCSTSSLQVLLVVTLLSLLSAVRSQTVDSDQCTSANSGPVTINTFGACASAEMETKMKALEDMVIKMRDRGVDNTGTANRLTGR